MPLSIVQSDFVDVNIPTIKTPTQQIFTTVGTSTWTRPTGCTKVKVTVIGGGGGAGGNFTKASFNGHVGINGAGGGGGTSIRLLDVSSIASVEVTVGAGGNGGGSTSNGSAGGTSSFGTYATANGGGGGNRCGTGTQISVAESSTYATLLGIPGAGGTAADGDLNLKVKMVIYLLEVTARALIRVVSLVDTLFKLQGQEVVNQLV